MAKIFGKLLAAEKGSMWLKEIQIRICVSFFSRDCDKMPDQSKVFFFFFFRITVEGLQSIIARMPWQQQHLQLGIREMNTLTHPTFSVFIQS